MTSKRPAVIRNSEIAWQQMQEKVVLVSPKTMRIHILHGSGGSIWEYLKKSRSEDELAELLCDEYDTTPIEAEKDVRNFLNQLKKEELVISDK